MIKSKIKDICVVAVFACLLVLGSMFDFRFSDNIYSENNWFNIFIELIAKMPIYSIGLYACASLFVLSSFKVNRYHRIVLYALYIVGAIVCGALMLEDVVSVFVESKIKYIISAVIGIVFFVFFVIGLKDKKETIEVNKKAYLTILFTIACIVVITFVLKSIMDRTRFVDIILREGTFTNWYKKGAGGDSMPSGHVASIVALFSCLPLLHNTKVIKMQPWLEYLLLSLIALVVAISRISNGSHFLSDVAVGGLIAFVISKAFTWLFYGFSENNNEIKKGSFLDLL